MRICFIANEIFAFGKHGGFGRATRTIGRELSKEGHEVFAVIPRRGIQKKHEILDGINVLGYEINNPLGAGELLVEADAQIYHSEEPSFISFLAQLRLPKRKHVITFRDTRNFKDWVIEFDQPSKSKLQVIKNILFEDSIFSHLGVKRADALGAAAKFLIEKSKRKYHLKESPLFLPTPVQIPAEIIKSKKPQVVFVSRLDRRKRPEKFYDLASHFPNVDFFVVGKGQDQKYISGLNQKYSGISNLNILDFIDQFNDSRFSEILKSAWILVNSSSREGLPNSFLEATAHQCAILSEVDPDGFASNFGFHAQDSNFKAGLDFLLSNDEWKKRGHLGQDYIRQAYWSPRAIKTHTDLYNTLLDN